jgi:hypothetical protein
MLHAGAIHDFEGENLSQLMSGVLCNGDYLAMPDYTAAQADTTLTTQLAKLKSMTQMRAWNWDTS